MEKLWNVLRSFSVIYSAQDRTYLTCQKTHHIIPSRSHALHSGKKYMVVSSRPRVSMAAAISSSPWLPYAADRLAWKFSATRSSVMRGKWAMDKMRPSIMALSEGAI